MAEKDQQHFLPKSYLSNFSNFSNNKEIGIYHPARGLYIKSGKLKTQCRKLKYYGDDKITENKLMHLEGAFKKLMLKIIRSKYIPKPGSNEYDELIHMILVTDLRNPTVTERKLRDYEAVNELDKSRFPDKLQPLWQVPKGFNHPAMLVDIASDAISSVRDLECALLTNETSYSFITSDYPTIKYNQFAESRGINYSATGFASLGLQYFLPIDPKNMIMLYDPKIYQLKDNEQIVAIKTKKEIFTFNLLQFLNNYELLYFNQDIDKVELQRLHNSSLVFERGSQLTLKTLYDTNPDGTIIPHRGMYLTKNSFSTIDLDTSFLNQTEFARKYPKNLNEQPLRKESMDALLTLPEDMQKYVTVMLEHRQRMREL